MIQDSGERTEFETGAQRDCAEGKGRYDLLSPLALARLAKHMEEGAKKYSDRNWEKGIPLHSFFDSAIRHLYKWLSGECDEDHLAAAFWNIHGLIHTSMKIETGELPDELWDLPNADGGFLKLYRVSHMINSSLLMEVVIDEDYDAAISKLRDAVVAKNCTFDEDLVLCTVYRSVKNESNIKTNP